MTHIRTVDLQDIYDHPAAISFMRDLKVAIPHRLVGTAFIGSTLDPNYWSVTKSVGDSAYTQADHNMQISSGTANSGYAHLQSARPARFVFAHPHIYRAACRISTGASAVTHNTRRWGAYTVSGSTPQNGYYFELSNTGVLSVVSCKAGTPTAVASGDWNGDYPALTMDDNLHAYEIHYFIMKVEFYIDGNLIHTLTPTTGNIISDQNLYIGATTVNSASGTTSGIINLHAATIMRIGKDETQPRSHFQVGTVAAQVLKYGPGLLHSICVSNVTNNAVITLYDNTAATGTAIWASGAMSNSTMPFSLDLHGLPFYTGLTLAITGANCNAVVLYE
jgi:hypothetical protein